MSNTICVVGSINADLTLEVDRHPSPGETLLGTGGHVSPGGKGANQAAAAAFLGGKVRLVGAVGDDSNAEKACSLLYDAGVDLSAVRATKGPTGLAVVTVDARGENSIIVVPGANSRMDASVVKENREVIATAGVVVLQGEIPRCGIEEAIALVSGRVVLNLAPVMELSVESLGRCDPLVVNEHESRLLLQFLDGAARVRSANRLADSASAPEHSPGKDPLPDQPPAEDHALDDSPRGLIGRLHAYGIPSVVITLGADGALVSDGHEVTPIPSPQVDVVDTTGAGDAFVGGLALKLAEGSTLVEAARFAARVGAYACTGHGAQKSYARDARDLPTPD